MRMGLYPNIEDIKTSGIDFVPETLKTLMNKLIVSKRNSTEPSDGDKRCAVINHDQASVFHFSQYSLGLTLHR